MKGKEVEVADIKIDIQVTKEKGHLVLHRQIAEGGLPDGTKYRIIDTGGEYSVRHETKETGNCDYSISKEEFLRELVSKVLIEKPKWKNKKE